MKALLRKIRQILRDRRVRRFFTRVVSTLAAIVVFVTTYALVLPAITLERVATCGIEEHQHTDDCWSEVLICDIPESDGHEHNDDCYSETRELVCEIPEHVHSVENGCYDEDGNLVCSEVEHTHGDGCYKEVRTLTCKIPESEGHHHDSSCYEKVLTCGKEYHVHSAACYKDDAANSGSTESAAVAASTGASAVEDESGSASTGATSGTSTIGVNADEAATAATTNVLPEELADGVTEDLSTGYAPQLEPVDMDTVLNKHTGFYYFDASEYTEEYAAEDGTAELPANSAEIEDWKEYNEKNDKLEDSDLLRLYLSYTVPAGTLNETNQVSRYRLPSNIRLTDDQIVAINETVNGIAGQYVDMSTLEITDPDKYEFYRGAEAIEGDRTPDVAVNDYLYNLVKAGGSGEEYISAVVKAENVFDDHSGEWVGQDLIFIWTPYSIEKNQNEYDTDGQPTKAGEKITGWFACDFNTSQVDWESVDSVDSAATADEGEDGTAAANVEKTAEMILVNEDKSAGIKEISETLTLVEETADNHSEDAPEGDAENAATGDTEDAADADTVEEDQSEDAEKSSTGETASDAASAGDTAEAAGSADTASTEKEEKKYSSGTLTATGESYTITLDYTADACIPEDAQLKVTEITEESDPEAYKSCLETASREVASDEKTTVDETATRFFDIEIIVTDESGETQKIEPKASVSVNIQLDTPDRQTGDTTDSSVSAQEPTILHFADEGTETLEIVNPSDGQQDAATAIQFEAESFSIYGVVYTVDFHWEVNGKTYDFSIPGGGYISLSALLKALRIPVGIEKENTDAAETSEGAEETSEENAATDREISDFVANVANVEFSNPDLLWVGKVDAASTVKEIKESNGLDIQYSLALTKEQIEETNSTVVESGDWALISLLPFNTEETLTVTMKTGDLFTISVTDYQPVSDTAAFNSTDSFVIAFKDNQDQYHVLKTDGTQEVISSLDDIDYLDNRYKWKFYYVFEEKDPNAPNANTQYYFIRPISDLSQSIALNDVGEDLVQYGTNNIGIIPQSGGFYLEGYANNNEDVPNLYFNGTNFAARMYEKSLISIFKQDDIRKYEFTVRTADPSMGLVSGKDKTGTTKTDVEEFVTRTKDNNNNNWSAEAKAVTEMKEGKNRYLFDYFDLNGVRVPDEDVIISSDGRTGKIKDNTLWIPYNGSVLTAHFKLNPEYVGPATVEVDALEKWVEEIRKKNIPFDEAATKKTAEVYDYENRIYRVDLTTKSSLASFNGIVDLGLILDVSGSMKFPSKLVPAPEVSGEKNIWQINNETSPYSGHYVWQDWGMDSSKTYYVIAEKTTRSTVFRLRYVNGAWRRIDSSYDGDGDWIGTWEQGGHNYTRFGVDPEGTTYTIYVSGDNDSSGNPVTRSYYEKQSIDNTANILNQVLGILNVAADEDDHPVVRAAWNTFAYDVRSSQHSFVELNDHNSLNIDYATQGGTRTDTAMTDALSFEWGSSNTKYAILITDGAPQYSSNKEKNPDYPGGTLEDQTTTLINNIKSIKQTYEQRGIKLITVGLSMKDVERGSRLLYDIADSIDGERMFFEAESGDELEGVLLKIVKKIMEDCTVYGDVQDTISDAFYIVDKNTGRPVSAGQYINLAGEVTTDTSQPYGIVQADGKTVKWIDQAFRPDGWRGSVYVKAKEDLLGGNAMPTNTGSATFDARTYATKSQPDNKITLKTTETDHFKPHKELETPLVNVNELLVDYNSTEWTVYLGTSVDPREELKKLYENVKVMEVVKKGQAEDEDHDGLPEIGKTDSDNLWYPLEPDSFSDDRESQGSGEREFYYLKDLIRNLTGENDLDWDSLIDGDVITIPYHVYGINDNSSITIRLNKTVAQGEPGLTPSPHDTAVTGEAVEKYQLIIDYSPDYSVLPKGQGGTSTRDFHTGTYGTIYQGHAAGRETRTNEHTINVFERKLQIEKVDESGNKITGDGEVAYFSIYRKSADGSAVEGLPAGKYEKVADRIATNPADALTDAISLVPTANTDGTETNAYIGTSKTYQKYYIDQTEYYVVEETAPNGYIKAALPSEFDFALSETKTPVVVNEEGEVVLYNWVQAASDSETVKIVKVTNEKMPEKGIIQLEKVWKDHDGNVITSDTGAHPASISYDLYRVKHVHEWETDQPVVDKEATPEEPGLAHYNCKHDGCTETLSFTVPRLVCEFDDNWQVTTPATCVESGIETRYCTNHDPHHSETRVIEATGIHIWGSWSGDEGTVWNDDQWAVGADATCEDMGYHYQVCKTCGMEKREYDIPAKGHSWGGLQEHPATCEEDGYYYRECSVCHAVEIGESIPATGHRWDSGVQTKAPTEDEYGEMTYTCLNDSSHTKTEPIDKIRNTIQVYYRLRSMYYGLTEAPVGDWEANGAIEAYIGGKIIVSYSIKNTLRDERYAYGEYRDIAGNPLQTSPALEKIPYTTRSSSPETNYQTYNDYYLEIDVVEGNELTLYLQTPDASDPTGGHMDFTIYSIPPATAGTQSVSPRQSMSPMSSVKTLKSSSSKTAVSKAASSKATALKAPSAKASPDPIEVNADSATLITTGTTTYDALNTMINRIGYTDGGVEHHYYIVEKIYSGTLGTDGWTASYNVDLADDQNNPYTYVFVETDPAPDTGWETTYAGQDEPGQSIGGKTIITNKQAALATGALEITKNVTYNNGEVPADKQFLLNKTFTFSITKGGTEITGGPFTITGSDSLLVPNLEEGDYVISETDSAGLVLKTVTGGSGHDDTAKTVTVHVTSGKTAKADLLDTAKAAFTNNYTEYEVVVIKEDNTDTSLKLNGAVFDLYEASQVDAGGSLKPEAEAKATGLTTAGTGDSKGKVSLGALTPGKYYLFEQSAPDGYDRLTELIEININDGTVSLSQWNSVRSGTIIQGKTELEVYNNPGVELPHTGGPGTRLFTILGSILILGAGVLLWRRRRLRRFI